MIEQAEARYSGSKSARSEVVRVLLGAAALSFVRADGVQETWNYDTLFAEPSLGRRDSEGLLHPRGNPAETLWVSDTALLDELRRRAPHITSGSRTRTWLMIAAALLLLVGGGYALIEATGAQPARLVAKQLPVKARVKLGEQLIGTITARHGRCVAPDGQAALKDLVGRFERHRLDDELPWKVSVVGWPMVNAFAVPGGSIVLTKGLIDKAQSSDEVAGVLAHEIGHAQALHPEAGIVRALGVSVLIEFMTGGSGGALSGVGTNVVLMNSTRNAEREADETALSLMRKENISPKGFRDFFVRMKKRRRAKSKKVAEAKPADGAVDKTADGKKKARGFGNVLMDVFSTHPGADERIARVEKVEDYDSAPALSAEQWTALKGICSKIEGKVGASKS